MVLLGGFTGSLYRRDVWESVDGGGNWRRILKRAPFRARCSHAACFGRLPPPKAPRVAAAQQRKQEKQRRQ